MIRLSVLNDGHTGDEAAALEASRERTGREPLGVVKTLLYRPELFAGFTALVQQCPY